MNDLSSIIMKENPIGLRMLYQRESSILLSSKHPFLSRYFTLKSMDDSLDILSNKAGVTKLVNEKKDETTEKILVDNNNFVCRYCGTLLFPGYCNTTLRVVKLKRGKTRRRRASRMKRKSFEKTDLKKNWENSYTILKDARMKERESRRLGDGEAKNCVSYTCGYCGSKHKSKGMPVERRIQDETIGNRESIKKYSRAKQSLTIKSLVESNEKIRPKSSFESIKKNENDRSESCFSFKTFLKRGKTDLNETNNVGLKNKQKFSILESRQKKPKKEDDSKLIKFLSSLNN